MSTITPIELVDYIFKKGFYLYVENDDLHIEPADGLSLEQRQFIEKNKTKLMLGVQQRLIKNLKDSLNFYWNEIEEKDIEIRLFQSNCQLYAAMAANKSQRTGSIESSLLKRIKMLCHPDRHANSQLSNKVMAELNKMA